MISTLLPDIMIVPRVHTVIFIYYVLLIVLIRVPNLSKVSLNILDMQISINNTCNEINNTQVLAIILARGYNCTENK